MRKRGFSLLLLTLATTAGAASKSLARGGLVSQPSQHTGFEQPTGHTKPPPEQGKLEQPDLAAYVDGIVPRQLVRGGLAGAAVIVIYRNQVLLEKGYGFADLKRKIAIDPDQTMFRFASISKLMTYVSAMQLVEQGRLNLDADVNRYLDFGIEPAFNKPVTLRDLMTHTAGFEHQQQYILQHETDPRIPLREYLVRYQPQRIYSPGSIGSYSDYGVGLMGYIVERVSGERFEDYVQHHIFDPLGMAHSTFAQPVQPQFHALVSQGYFSSAREPDEFEVFNPVPAGGLSATLADIARFAQAMLDGGEWNGNRILRPETVHLMWTRQFSVSPALPAMCMGFYEVERNGLRFVGHNGDTRVFHTQLEIQPENSLIILSAYNSAGADNSGQESARWEIFNGILDRYFPYTQRPVWAPVDARAREIAGAFIKARRMESGRLKLDSLMEQIEMRVNADGELVNKLAVDARGRPIKLRYLGNDLWQDEIGQGRMIALRDAHGRVNRLASMFGATMMVRVLWWEDARFVLPLLGFALGACGLVICGVLLQVVLSRFRAGRFSVPFTAVQRYAALVWILAVPLMLLVFRHIAREPLPAFDHVPYYFLLQNILVVAAILLSVFSILQAVKAVRRRDAALWDRVKHVAVSASYIFLIWFSLHWHLFGPLNRY